MIKITDVKLPEIINIVNEFNIFQKLEIYLHYYTKMQILKYDFDIGDKQQFNWKNGWGAPDKETNEFAYYFLWKNIRISNFEDFASDTNFTIIENYSILDPKYKYRVDIFGIYDWYSKFRNDFKFNNYFL